MYKISYSQRVKTSKQSNKSIIKIASKNLNVNVICSLFLLSKGEIVIGSWNNEINILFPPFINKIETLSPSHDNWVKSFLEVKYKDNHLLLSGSRDKSIKIWNIKNHPYINVTTLTFHQGTIYSMIQIQNYILSASFDFCIIIWDIESYNIFSKLNIHSSPVLKLINLDSDKYCSCSEKGDIIINDFPNQLICKVKGSKQGVVDLFYNSDKHLIFSLEKYCFIRVWELTLHNEKSYMDCILTICLDLSNNIFILPNSFYFFDSYIFICCNHKEILSYGTNTFLNNKQLTIKQTNSNFSQIIKIKEQNIIITSSVNSELAIWKIQENN